jgi:hypothetical protein
VSIWDLRKTQKHVKTFHIFPKIVNYMAEIYEKESIFEKFTVSSNKDDSMVLSGMFNNNFYVSSLVNASELEFKCDK